MLISTYQSVTGSSRNNIFRHASYEMRSHSETRWAGMMDALSVNWIYEPETIETRHGWYKPDFFLPAVGAFVEVKGPEPTKVEQEKAEDAEAKTGFPVIFAYGAPEMIGAELCNGSVGYYSGGRLARYTTKEIGAVVLKKYDMATYAAFLAAGDRQALPESEFVGDLIDELARLRMTRSEVEAHLDALHAPLNAARLSAWSGASRAEFALATFVDRIIEVRGNQRRANHTEHRGKRA